MRAMQPAPIPSGKRRRLPREMELRHFEEACELLRHYSNLRFRQLTIFVGVNGGLLFILFRYNPEITPLEVFACAALGLLAACAFLLLEIRLNRYLDHYRAVVTVYESEFGLQHMLYTPQRLGSHFRGRQAIYLFLAGMAAFWTVIVAMLT